MEWALPGSRGNKSRSVKDALKQRGIHYGYTFPLSEGKYTFGAGEHFGDALKTLGLKESNDGEKGDYAVERTPGVEMHSYVINADALHKALGVTPPEIEPTRTT